MAEEEVTRRLRRVETFTCIATSTLNEWDQTMEFLGQFREFLPAGLAKIHDTVQIAWPHWVEKDAIPADTRQLIPRITWEERPQSAATDASAEDEPVADES